MNNLQSGIYDVTDKAARAAQKMGWFAVYMTALWVGNAVVGVCARVLLKNLKD